MLLVSHERLDPELLEYRGGAYTLDVHKLSGRKILEDVRLPGGLLTAGTSAYFLLSRGPDKTAIGAYTLRDRERVSLP